MWICKYCETRNDAGNTHCFLCGFFNDPAVKTAVSVEVEEAPERNSKVIVPVEEKKPEKPDVSPKPESLEKKTVEHTKIKPDKRAIDITTDDYSVAEKMYEDDKRLALTAMRNKKKQNRVKVVFAVVNILLAAANAAVCYFVFR